LKKLLSLTLAIIMAFTICACGDKETPAETPTPFPAATPAPTPEATPEPTPEPTPAPPEGEIFLNVSSLTFSTVGESENIYAGTIPAEEVLWKSGDEGVVTVENGVLTAVGVGAATVYAEFGEQHASCTVSCLAWDEEGLMALPEEILRSPKRMPVHLDNPPTDYFSDSAIIGDSITYFLFQFESKSDLLGDALFLTRGGTSLLGIQNRSYNVYFQGQDLAIEDSVAASGRKKLFFMLGQNDLGYRTIEDTLASYEVIINRIREKSPDVEIYIQSLVHEWWERGNSNSRNEKIDQYNAELVPFAERMGCHYVDIAKYIEDHRGTMAAPYNMDYGIHVNEEGCTEWMHALLSYAYIEMMGENAK